jgi:hypothetical protein
MSENIKPRKIDLDADTTEIKEKVLSLCPADCLRDRGRLCIRITTLVARAEHAYKFGKPEEDIINQALESAYVLDEYCLEGITIKDGRTECGHGKDFGQDIDAYPEWLFKKESTDGDV